MRSCIYWTRKFSDTREDVPQVHERPVVSGVATTTAKLFFRVVVVHESADSRVSATRALDDAGRALGRMHTPSALTRLRDVVDSGKDTPGQIEAVEDTFSPLSPFLDKLEVFNDIMNEISTVRARAKCVSAMLINVLHSRFILTRVWRGRYCRRRIQWVMLSLVMLIIVAEPVLPGDTTSAGSRRKGPRLVRFHLVALQHRR